MAKMSDILLSHTRTSSILKLTLLMEHIPSAKNTSINGTGFGLPWIHEHLGFRSAPARISTVLHANLIQSVDGSGRSIPTRTMM